MDGNPYQAPEVNTPPPNRGQKPKKRTPWMLVGALCGIAGEVIFSTLLFGEFNYVESLFFGPAAAIFGALVGLLIEGIIELRSS